MCIPIRVIMGVSPYSCCAEAKKRRDPQGFASSIIIVLVACHVHIGLERGSQGFTIEVYYVKSMGIKIITQQFILGTCMTLSYLLWYCSIILGDGGGGACFGLFQ